MPAAVCAAQTAYQLDEPHEHWHQHDYVGDDHEERAEQALLDRQIRLERDLQQDEGAQRVGVEAHHANHMKKPWQVDPLLAAQHDAHGAEVDHEAAQHQADQVGSLRCNQKCIACGS